MSAKQIEAYMAGLIGILKENEADPGSVQIDIGQARQLSDALGNLIAAHDQEEAEGKDKKKSKSGNGDEEEKDEKDEGKEESEKKSPGY